MTPSHTDSKQKFRCKVCGHAWTPRKTGTPRYCANRRCHSENWNVGRQRPPIAEQRQQARQRRIQQASEDLMNVTSREIDDLALAVPRQPEILRKIEELKDLLHSSAERNAPLFSAEVTLYRFPAATMPCGPWKEVFEELEAFRITGEFAAALNAQEGDWLVICEGESMVGADIPDGTRLIMRPLYRNGEEYEAEQGDVCLIQACTSESCYWTIKKWHWQGNDVVLRDGNRKKMGLPADTKSLKAMAVKQMALVPGRK